MCCSSFPTPPMWTSRALAWQVACHPSLLAWARLQVLRLSSWEMTARQTSPSSKSMPHRTPCHLTAGGDAGCTLEGIPDPSLHCGQAGAASGSPCAHA